MDRDEALKLLRGGPDGVKEWNRWRTPYDEEWEPVPLSLERVDLAGAKLDKVSLAGMDLTGAVPSEANLSGANLAGAFLSHADLSGAIVTQSDLRQVILSGANLYRANLLDSNLSGLRGPTNRPARLDRCNLCKTVLHATNLTLADLHDSDLSGADLQYATLNGADLTRANLRGAKFSRTIIGCKLDSAIALDDVDHRGPSQVSVDTILRFKGDLPATFLRGCGLQEEEIAYFRGRVGKPIRFYTCFISYSTDDEEFASRLHNDFQAAGIRCWKWNKDAKTGESMWGEIDQAIRDFDKLVLIASASSLKSPYVQDEIERAIQKERKRQKLKAAGQYTGNTNVLFPVRLDDYIFKGWEHERKVDVTKKVIADARGWSEDPEVYAQVRDKLIRDLKADGE
ncbi:MAG: toll/interleukin-1 receptor domain-containing protein [Candidatus Eisenbacteria sp.]|nr:toll/interleukin-1 receptor domain-containing protein [Candidatus Eisenbacteria bacterium]